MAKPFNVSRWFTKHIGRATQLIARLRSDVQARDAEIAHLRAELERLVTELSAAREQIKKITEDNQELALNKAVPENVLTSTRETDDQIQFGGDVDAQLQRVQNVGAVGPQHISIRQLLDDVGSVQTPTSLDIGNLDLGTMFTSTEAEPTPPPQLPPA
jgi:septal ring factor EnvC (AmiA/AmiB activator)